MGRLRTPLEAGGGLSTGQIIALGLVLALAVLAVPFSAAATGVQKVVLANSNGTPLNVVHGTLGVGDGKGAMTVNGNVNILPPGPPLHYEDYGLQPFFHNVVKAIPPGVKASITSVAAVCSDPAGGDCDLFLFDAGGSDCSTQAAWDNGNVILVMVVSPSNPSIEFTFPTPRPAPDFTPNGPWCLGARVDNGVMAIAVDGYTSQ
jgi:hypothetical protein